MMTLRWTRSGLAQRCAAALGGAVAPGDAALGDAGCGMCDVWPALSAFTCKAALPLGSYTPRIAWKGRTTQPGRQVGPIQTNRLCSTAAPMNDAKSGCGSCGRLFNSGWYCTPMNHG